MTSWLREIQGRFLVDPTHVVIDAAVYNAIDAYHASVPTSPSAGRVYRRTTPEPHWPNRAGAAPRHWLYIVTDDPAAPGVQVHTPYEALLV